MLERIKPKTKLVNLVLDELPNSIWTSETTTFFDGAIGGGQFVAEIERRLRRCGHSDENIRKRVFGFEYNQALVDMSVNMNKLVGQYAKKPYHNYLDVEATVKFDVIVGNPPYHDSTKTEKGGSTLWAAFAKKSIELVKDDGYVALVTPNAWMGFGKTGAPLKPWQLHTVFTNISNYFPNVGSTFTAWVLQKTPVYTSTNFVDEDVELDLRHFDTLPVGRPLKGLPIIDKVMNRGLPLLEPRLETGLKGGWSKRQNRFINGCDGSLTPTDRHTYQVFHTNSLQYWVPEEPNDYDVPKIIVSVTSPSPRIYTEPMGCAAGDLRCYIPIRDQHHGECILSYLNSPLYRFVWRRPGMISWTALAMPELEARVWTNEELYEFFDITDEEQEMIEGYAL